MGGTSRVGVGSRPSACPGRVRPGASGHCVLGLRQSRLPWPRGQVWSWPLRERLGTVAWYLPRTPGGGPSRSGLGLANSSSLRLSRSWRTAHLWAWVCGCGQTFLAPPWGQRRVVTLESRRRPSPPALFRRPLPVMFTAHGVLLEAASDRGVISFWNAPPNRSLSRVLPCPLPVTVRGRGWGGRSRLEFTLRPGPFPSRWPPPRVPQTLYGLRTPLGPWYFVEEMARVAPPPSTHSQETFLTSARGLGQLEPAPRLTPDPSGDPSASGAFLPRLLLGLLHTGFVPASAHGPQRHVEGLQRAVSGFHAPGRHYGLWIWSWPSG